MSDRTIVIIVPHDGTIGRSPHIDRILPSLDSAGWETEVWGWEREPLGARHGSPKYDPVLSGGAYASWSTIFLLPWFCLRVAARIVRRRPERVMAVNFESGLAAAAASLITGKPFIYNVRDNFSLRWRLPVSLKRVLDSIDAWIVRRATVVILPDEIRVPTSADSRKIAIVRNCAPQYVTDPSPVPLDRDRLVVAAIGYLRRTRGMLLLLEVCRANELVTVVAAGQAPEADIVDEMKRTPRCEYRGLLTPAEAAAIVSESDVVFSFYDPSIPINRHAVSNKWSDAMMCGRPIIVNREVEKARWLDEIGVALVAPEYSAAALEETLKRAQSDRGALATMGERGRHEYDEGYSWDVMEGRFLAALDRAFGDR